MEPTTAPGLDTATHTGEATALNLPRTAAAAPAGCSSAGHWLSHALALWMTSPDPDAPDGRPQPATH